ncbi:MAG: hypothetical protein QXJ72_06405 [Thermoproteota archaeon]
MRLVKQNPAFIFLALSFILLIDYALLLREERVNDANTVGRYVQYLLIISCLMYLSVSLHKASRKITKHKIIVRIPIYKIEKLFKAFKNSVIFVRRKYGQLYACLSLLSLISSFIFFLLGELGKAALLFYVTFLLVLVAIIMQLLSPIALPKRPRHTIRIPAYLLREYFNRKKIKKYVSENSGIPFILGFQILLILCATLFLRGAETTANELAVYAYYMLVIGVLLQLVSYIRERRKTS